MSHHLTSLVGALGALALLATSAAVADDESSTREPSGDKWNVLLGAGVINQPRYPGSRIDFTRGLPAVSISYDRYFIGGVPGGGAPAGVGAYLVRTEHWAFGLDVSGDSRKPESRRSNASRPSRAS